MSVFDGAAELSYHFRKVSINRPTNFDCFPLTVKQTIDALLGGTAVSEAHLLHHPKADAVISALIINNVTLAQGAIFASANRDQLIQDKLCIQAAANGAVLVITSNPEVAKTIQQTSPDCGIILCKNTQNNDRDPVVRSLRPLAEKVRDCVQIPVLSISGTSGKTTTRDLATSILKASSLKLSSTQKNDNNIWGTTLSVLDLNHAHECALYEFGSDGPNQTSILAKIAKPTITYTTSIGVAHIDGVGGIDQMLSCETEQYDWMIDHSHVPPIFLANMDDPMLCEYFNRRWNELNQAGTVFTVSSTPGKSCDYQLQKVTEFVENDRFFSEVYINTPHGIVHACVPLIGRHNHANICGAVGLSLSSGLSSIEDVILGLQLPTFTGYRSEFFREPIGNALILNDSFNSNPSGLEASLVMAMEARNLMQDRIARIVLVLGDMNELGQASCEHHFQMGRLAKKLGISEIYCHGKFASSYIDGFGSTKPQFEDKESLYAAFRTEVIQTADASTTLVLIKGSGKTKTSQIADWLREGKAPTSLNYR